MRTRCVFRAVRHTLAVVFCSLALVAAEAVMFLRSDYPAHVAGSFASRYLLADVQIENLRLTSLASFPRIGIKASSVAVIPRIIGVDPRDTLLLADNLHIGIDAGEISPSRLHIDMIDIGALDLRLLQASDSLDNWSILPPAAADAMKIHVTFGQVKIGGNSTIRYASAPARTAVALTLNRFSMIERGGKERSGYNINLSGLLNLETRGRHLADGLPVEVAGPVGLTTFPLSVSLAGCRLQIGPVDMSATLRAQFYPELRIDTLSLRVNQFHLNRLLESLPVRPPGIPGLTHNLTIGASLALTSPFRPAENRMPSFIASLDVPEGELNYTLPGGASLAADVALQASGEFYGENPAESIIRLHHVSVLADRLGLSASGHIIRPFSPTASVNLAASLCVDLAELARLCGINRKIPMSGNAASRLSLTFNPHNPVQSAIVNLSLDLSRVSVALKNRQIISGGKGKVEAYLAGGGRNCRASVTLGNIAYGGGIRASIDTLQAHASVSPQGGFAALSGLDARRVASALNIVGALSARGGRMFTPAFPSTVKMEELDAAFRLDTLKVGNLKASAGNTPVRINGTASGIITGCTSSRPLKIKGDVKFPNLAFNELAATFRKGAGRDALIPARVRQNAGQDLKPVRLPQWLDLEATIGIGSMKCVTLPLGDFRALGTMSGGNLDITSLHAVTPFCEGNARVSFRTSDPEDISLGAGVDIDSLSLTALLQTFPVLRQRVPDLSLLQATADISIEGGFSTFPDMVINLPSARGSVTLDAYGISLKFNERLRRYAGLLLIHDKDMLKVDDFSAHAEIADDMVTLTPFTITAGRYSFGVMGRNDFNSNLYYHAAVLHSPVPFKFGVNFFREDNKYKIRFGGPRYDIKDAMSQAAIMPHRRINMITELKYYFGLLIDAAAHEENLP